MKYVIATLFGVFVGVAAAGAALYYNPLTNVPESSTDDSWTLGYDFPAGSTLALTHAGQLSLPRIPPDIEALWEGAIERVVLSVLVLEDESGTPRALASRVSFSSDETDLLLRGFLVADHWLITVPGQGTLFVDGENNLWPFLKESLIPVKYLGQQWSGPVRYPVTVGPAPRRAAVVFGVSGAFAGVYGSARETYDLKNFSATFGIEALRGTLAVTLDDRVDADAVAAELTTAPAERAAADSQ